MKGWWPVWLLMILLGATALRFWGLGARSLWLDEALSWRFGSFPIALMVERTSEASTAHPPLYFALLHFWMGSVGDSELALRSLSAGAGVLAVAAMFWFVWELTCFGADESGKNAAEGAVRAGLIASALMACSAYQIQLAHQVRGYALGILLCLLASAVLVRALRVGRVRWAPWLWASYAMLVLALCYTHSLAVLSVAGHGLFALIHLGRADSRAMRRAGAAGERPEPASWAVSRWRGPVLAGAVVAAGFLPWTPSLLAQSECVRTSWRSAPAGIEGYVGQIHTALLLTSADRAAQSRSLAWCSVLALAAVLAVAPWRLGSAGVFLICAGCVPPALILLYGQFSIRSLFYARYFAFAQPMWLAAFAAVVASVPFRAERALLVGLLLLWSGFSCWNGWGKIGPAAEPGMRGAAAYLRERRSQDEIVVAQSPFEFFKLLYYLRDTARPVLCVAGGDRYAQRGTSHLLDGDLVTADAILELEPRGLWLVTSASYDPSCQADFSLPDEWKAMETREFVQDFHLERPITVRHVRKD